jgi:SAM-dependent methyltransferase
MTNWLSEVAARDLLGPPLRPAGSVIETYRRLVAGYDREILLLGVTPELTDLGHHLVAVDRSAGVISRLWSGNGADHHAVLGDWRALPLASASFTAIVGDGSLNWLRYPEDYLLVFNEIARVARPAAIMAVRIYCTPEATETLEEARALALSGRETSFHALKWRIAMALAAARRDANLFVADILTTFDLMFPDRDELAVKTGWRRHVIDTIDNYRDSAVAYSFPKETQLLNVLDSRRFAEAKLIPNGPYALAERCPILRLSVPG